MKRGVWLLVLSLSLGMALASPGQLFKTAKVPEGTQVHRNLEYVKGGHERRKLDLYVPGKADGPLPVIVWVHPGAWMFGGKEECPAIPFLSKGYAVVSINHRYSRQSPFPAQTRTARPRFAGCGLTPRPTTSTPNASASGGRPRVGILPLSSGPRAT